MLNATIFKSAGACTDSSLPKLYRDSAIGASTLFCYDLLDTYTWPTQAAPTAGASIVDLAAVADSSINTVALTGYGASGGFTFANTSLTPDIITLPPSSKLATTVAGFAISIWIKPLNASGSGGIAGIGDGYVTTNAQYAFSRAAANVNLVADGVSVGAAPVSAGVVCNLIITTELSGGTYTHKSWKNGVQVSNSTSSSPMVNPALTAATIGALRNITAATSDAFTFYRCHADSLASRTAAQFVAAEYAAGMGRFA